MKTRFLIIIGIIILLIIGVLFYNSISTDDISKDIDVSQMILLEHFKDIPEVIAFYAKYDDADVSIRDDHISYFAGNEDNFRVRMNLYFDENYELDHLEFNCYVDRVPQSEVAEHFILKYLDNYDCKK